MIVSDYIVDQLIKLGVKDVFGYPGSLAGFTMEALRKRKGEINQHLLYEEQPNCFAAIANSQISGKIGVVWTTSGPGALNAVTACASAFYDSIPLLIITHNVSTNDAKEELGLKIRQSGNQEANVVEVFKPITKFAVRIDKANNTPKILDKAINEALNGRQGPVLIDIPIDISRTKIETVLDVEIKEIGKTYDKTQVLERIQGSITKANNPVIVLGGGIHSAKVEQSFEEWVKRQKETNSNLSIVRSMQGKDLLPELEPLGVAGVWGNEVQNECLKTADLVVSFGCRLSNRFIAGIGSKFEDSTKVIRVDIDELEFTRFIGNNTVNIKENLQNLFEVNPQKIQRIVNTDVGQNMWRSFKDVKPKQGDRLLFDSGNGCMGSAIPKAIGSYFACPDAKNIVIIGDGGLQMCLEELNFISQHNLPIKIVIMNNSSLGLIRAFQSKNFDNNFESTTNDSGYKGIDIEKLASLYDMDYKKFDFQDINELLENVEKLEDKPTLIEVGIDPVYP